MVLKEWSRVLKKGGKLVLLLPDQKRYEDHCKKHKTIPNEYHRIKEFSLSYVKKIAVEITYLKLIFEKDYLDQYSFAAVFEKTQESDLRWKIPNYFYKQYRKLRKRWDSNGFIF